MRSRILMVCGILVALAMAGTLAAQDDRYFLKSSAFEDRQRTGVEFNHLLHYELYECTDCHHYYENGENVWDMFLGKNYCSDCHTVQGDDNLLDLMRAFHESCVGCHRETLGLGKTTGPIMCGECHVR